MFFCEECRVRNEWPEGFAKSLGPCEICGKTAACYDIPSSALPPVKREKHLYEVTLSLSQVKVEHVGEVLRRLQAVDYSFEEEGVAIDSMWSVERDHDGVERWHEWIDSEGRIKDMQPWDEII